jgi:hypothetical protein
VGARIVASADLNWDLEVFHYLSHNFEVKVAGAFKLVHAVAAVAFSVVDGTRLSRLGSFLFPLKWLTLLALKFFPKETDVSTSFTIASLSAVHDAKLHAASKAHTKFFNFIFKTVLDGTFFFSGCLAFVFRSKGRCFFYTTKRNGGLFFL